MKRHPERGWPCVSISTSRLPDATRCQNNEFSLRKRIFQILKNKIENVLLTLMHKGNLILNDHNLLEIAHLPREESNLRLKPSSHETTYATGMIPICTMIIFCNVCIVIKSCSLKRGKDNISTTYIQYVHLKTTFPQSI